MQEHRNGNQAIQVRCQGIKYWNIHIFAREVYRWMINKDSQLVRVESSMHLKCDFWSVINKQKKLFIFNKLHDWSAFENPQNNQMEIRSIQALNKIHKYWLVILTL